MRFKHILPLLLTAAWAGLLCGCDQTAVDPPVADTTQAEESPDHTHAATEWHTAVAPTCTEAGYATGICAECGEAMQMPLPTLPHTYTETVTHPTCSEMGYTTYTCSCGHSYQSDETSPIPHTYTETVTLPTCGETGYTTFTCACGFSFNGAYVPSLGHTYTETVALPTCTEAGYTTYTCACGFSYTGSMTPSVGHSFTETVIPPTCTEGGYTQYLCTACAYEEKGSPVAPLAHENATAEIHYATVISDGFTRHNCPDCGETYDDSFVAYRDIVTGAYVDNTQILMQGVDTSKWNHLYGASLDDIKPLDFTALKAAGVDFVILKAGSTLGIDPAFELDYRDAKAAGLQVGAYFYAYSTTVEDTLADAEMLLTWLEGKQFELPIYFDMEETSMMSLGGELLTDLCRAFVTRLQGAGYYAALYTNTEWLYNLLDTQWVKENLDVWYARYTVSLPEGQEGFTLGDTDFPWKDGTAYLPGETDRRYGMWQYTDSGTVEGFRYKFDFNYAFKDYKTIMETWGLNGFAAQI